MAAQLMSNKANVAVSRAAPKISKAPRSVAAASGRFANYSGSSRSSTPVAAPAVPLSAGDLTAFKADDLAELCRKKGVFNRNANRQGLSDALVRAGITLNDLSRSRLVDLGIKLGKAGLPRDVAACRSALAGLVGKSGSAAPSWSSPATASTDRFSSYSSKALSAPSTPAASSGSGLSVDDLSHLRIDDLRDLVAKTGTQLPREPTKSSLLSALAAKGVTVAHLTRGMVVDLCTKLGQPLVKDVETMRRNLSAVVGKGGSATSSWRSTPAAAPAGDRFSSYSAGAAQKASWRRSGSYTAGASSSAQLSASDLASLRIDDLTDIARKTGAALPRDVTKDGLISALVTKGVSVNNLTRGMLVDLANKLGAPLAKDVEGLRKNLSSVVGKGGYSAPAASSTSSWRSTPAAAPAAPSNGRFAAYAGGNGNGNGNSAASWRSGSSASTGAGAVYEADLSAFKVDELTQLARKVGADLRNATKDSLVRTLAAKITVADLSKGQLVDILAKVGQPISGSVEDLRSRVNAAASARQSARSLAPARR